MSINRQNLEDLNKMLEMVTLIQQNLETLNHGNHLKDVIEGFWNGKPNVPVSELLASVYLAIVIRLNRELEG